MLMVEHIVRKVKSKRMEYKSSKTDLQSQQKYFQRIIHNNLPEEVECFEAHTEVSTMDFHSPVSFDPFDSPRINNPDSNEFLSEEYLEYRRRVFEELASEYKKLSTVDKHQQHPNLISEIPRDYHMSDMNDFSSISPTSPLSNFDYGSRFYPREDSSTLVSVPELQDDISPSQPTWDDSDLHSELINSPLHNEVSSDKDANPLTFGVEDENNLLGMESTKTEDKLPSMHWTELENQLELMTKHHEEKKTSPNNRPFSPPLNRRSSRNALLKQKNDRENIRLKLSMGDPEVDSIGYGSDKPWYQPRLERSLSANNQNLQLCYINNSCSSSDNEDESMTNTSDKTSPSNKTSTGGKPSPVSSPVLSSPGFGIRRKFHPIRMSSSSSTVSLSSTSSNGGHYTSSSSIPGDGEIINIRSSVQYDDIPKAKTMQEELELQARIAITQAHQEAKRQAEEERRMRKGDQTTINRLMHVPLDDATRLKIKKRSLKKADCSEMTFGQLQVILNEMHAEKEALNADLMLILETRDELKMEQDAKLIDIEDVKAMVSVTGPETTV